MSFKMNKCFVAGNLTRDPEVRFLDNGKSVANFTIATSRKFKDKSGEMKEETLFIDIDAWGRTAELVGEYLTKGSGAMVEGRLKLDTWEDKNTGEKRNRIKVFAESVQFTDSKSASADAPTQRAPAVPAPVGGSNGIADDEPPFACMEWLG